jgi:hypothetical protein
MYLLRLRHLPRVRPRVVSSNLVLTLLAFLVLVLSVSPFRSPPW